MAIAGGAKPSARLTLVNGNVVVDAFHMRQVQVLSTPEDAIKALKTGQTAYVQTYGDNVRNVKEAFSNGTE